MATLKRAIELDAMELGKGISIEIKLHRMREWRMRAVIVVFLLRLIELIAPFGVEVETDAD